MFKEKSKIGRGAGYVIAEIIGVIALLGILLLYIAAMGSYWISGVGLFLMPITVVGYMLFTQLSQKSSSAKYYWIFYAVKILFMIGLFLLGPVISDVMARLVNG
ncbi:MAG: hypothetical protein K2N56_02605 [Oscillospiraceae bacterium]|nr:hypothetical protein [Oscillospiraceae bacterium]